jgi:hypothetical protein
MNFLYKKTIGSIFFLFTSTLVFAQVNVVTTAVPFLRVSPDARSGGMGDLGIAISPDANAVFLNNARLAFIDKKSEIVLNAAPWLREAGFKDVNFFSAGGYKQLKNRQVISAAVRYFTLGNIQLTDFNGNLLNSVRPNEFSLEVGYTRLMSSKWSIGINFKYIHSQLTLGDAGFGNSYKAVNTIAGDVGFYYNGINTQNEGWRGGIVLQNLGPKVNYSNNEQNQSYLPANLGLGINYTKKIAENQYLSFGFELNKLLVPDPPTITGNASLDSSSMATYKNRGVIGSWFSSFDTNQGFFNALQASIGVEYNYNNFFWLRTGYFNESKERGDRKNFTAGVGFKYKLITTNFSYIVPAGNGITRNPLSNTLRLGLIFNLNK